MCVQIFLGNLLRYKRTILDIEYWKPIKRKKMFITFFFLMLWANISAALGSEIYSWNLRYKVSWDEIIPVLFLLFFLSPARRRGGGGTRFHEMRSSQFYSYFSSPPQQGEGIGGEGRRGTRFHEMKSTQFYSYFSSSPSKEKGRRGYKVSWDEIIPVLFLLFFASPVRRRERRGGGG